jgi:uncharacterized repeat protein (TIGR03803 family)
MNNDLISSMRCGSTRRALLKTAAGAAALFGGLPDWAVAARLPPESSPAVFRTIHDFGRGPSPRAGGATPGSAPVQMSDGLLWGTTNEGGALGFGTIYAMTPRGDVLTMFSFAGTDGGFGSDISAGPGAPLVEAADGLLWGTVFGGGLGQGGATVGYGTVYRYERGGRPTTVYKFGQGATTGTNPTGGLTLASDGNLYGITGYGGNRDNGTVFRISPSGEASDLHVFVRGPSDGGRISSAVIQASDGNLWGVTPFGGAADTGIVFRLGLDGTYTVMHQFTGGVEGGEPSGSLAQGADGALYGITFLSGENDRGTIFRITLDGQYSVFYNFSGGSPRVGKAPEVGLTAASDGWLYGVTRLGSLNGTGSVFRINPAGEMQLLHAFAPSKEIVYKSGLSEGSQGRLYGVTEAGGLRDAGIVYSLRSRRD